MYEINEYIIYKNEVCIVKDILKKYYKGEDFYVLEPINDKSLSIKLPVSDKNKILRRIITKEEALNLINEIPKIETVMLDDKYLDNSYKELLNERSHHSLIKIIKTAYIRNEERRNNKLKAKEKDCNYFNMAEKLLYDELSIALEKSYDDTKKFVINEVKKLENK